MGCLFLFDFWSCGEWKDAWWFDLDCVGGFVYRSSHCWIMLAEEAGFDELINDAWVGENDFVCYN